MIAACLLLQCIGLVCFSRGSWIVAAVCLAVVFQMLCYIEPVEMITPMMMRPMETS